MRICVIGKADYPIIQRRVEAFQKRGHEVHVISLYPNNNSNYTIHYISSPSLFKRFKFHIINAIPQVSKLIKKINPDVIDIHGASSNGIYALLPLHKPIVVTVYGPDIYDHAAHSVLLRQMVKRILLRADMIVGSTPAIRDYITNIVGLDVGDKLRTRRGGIDVPRILRDAEQRRHAIRQEFGVAPHTRVVLHSRHIAELWRVKTLVRSIPLVIKNHPNTEFWFAFPPPNAAGERLLARLKEMVQEMGMTGHVRFLGHHPYDRMISIMHASDIYVCIGKNDLLAASIQEAACAGLIPILSDLPAYHELIQDQVNGFYVSNVTPENVAGRINFVMDNFDALKQQIVPYNQALIRQHYSLNAGISWLLSMYEEAIRRYNERN